MALKVTSPLITIELLDGVEPEPSTWVIAVVTQLKDGLDQGWIPSWLKVRISMQPSTAKAS